MTADHTVPPALADALRDRYELIRETGHGGSATVYLARDLKHDRFVALKVLNPDVAQSTGERFLREIQVSAGMQHPHILPTYDSGLVQGRLYFVMPFVDGGSLRQRLEAATALPVDEALRIAHDIAIALAHAHDLGVVHRDVKPENILFYHGHACLADFGVARAIEQLGATITAHGTIVGTPAYMSPEQFASADFDGRSDVYSLACVLFEMIAGTRVFSGDTAREVVKQRQRSAPSIRKLRDQVPLEVDALLARALATLPEDRYTDARAFALAIEQTAAALSVQERDSAPRRALANLRDRPRWIWVSATVGLAAFIGLAFTPLRDEVIARMPGTGPRVPTTGFRPFDAGNTALAVWDIAGAQRSFADAIAADPTFAPGHLWHAQSLALDRQAGTDAFRAAVMRLTGVRGELHGRDSLLAAGLIALGERQFPRACEIYESLRARDSLDVLAWYGLGDCHFLDSAVTRDARSPSGWSFRASWHAAASAYMRAATIEPSAHNAVPFALVTRLLPTDPVYVRLGRSTTSPQQLMLAHPSLAGDTLAWIPFPATVFQAEPMRAIAATHPDALRRNRQVLLAFARQWTAAAPRNPDAHEAHALAREAREELDEVDGALGATRQALRFTNDAEQRTRLSAALARLHLKRGEFGRARAIADSLLAADSAGATGVIARRLAGLASLTGRPGLAADLRLRWALPGYGDMNVPPPVATVAIRYFTRAASGACDDSIRALPARMEALLQSHSPMNRRGAMRSTAIGRAAALAYPCLGGESLRDVAPVTPLDRAQRAHVAGNARLARMILDSVAAMRRVARPGDVSIEDTFLEAQLRVAIGDTAAATRQLDLVLNALPTLGTLLVREEAQAAALGRVMLLRAELALAAGDRVAARRFGTSTLALWSGAEPVLAPVVSRLRVLAAQ